MADKSTTWKSRDLAAYLDPANEDAFMRGVWLFTMLEDQIALQKHIVKTFPVANHPDSPLAPVLKQMDALAAKSVQQANEVSAMLYQGSGLLTAETFQQVEDATVVVVKTMLSNAHGPLKTAVEAYDAMLVPVQGQTPVAVTDAVATSSNTQEKAKITSILTKAQHDVVEARTRLAKLVENLVKYTRHTVVPTYEQLVKVAQNYKTERDRLEHRGTQ